MRPRFKCCRGTTLRQMSSTCPPLKKSTFIKRAATASIMGQCLSTRAAVSLAYCSQGFAAPPNSRR